MIVVTTAEGERHAEAAALTEAGARIVVSAEPGLAGALRMLPDLGVHSLLVEGGSVLQSAFWDEGLVDYVQLYEAPMPLGPNGVPLPRRSTLLEDDLIDKRVTLLGPDVLTEGYVHRPR